MENRDDVFKKKVLEKWALKRGSDAVATAKDLPSICHIPKKHAAHNLKSSSPEPPENFTKKPMLDSPSYRVYTVALPPPPKSNADSSAYINEKDVAEKRTRTEPQTVKNRKRKLKKKRRKEASKDNLSVPFIYKPMADSAD